MLASPNLSSVMPTIGQRSRLTISLAPSMPPADTTPSYNRSGPGANPGRTPSKGPGPTGDRQIGRAVLARDRAGFLVGIRHDRRHLRPIQLGSAARGVDRGPDSPLPRANR